MCGKTQTTDFYSVVKYKLYKTNPGRGGIEGLRKQNKMAASARHGAKKWLASLFGESASGAAASGTEKTSKSIAKERLQIILAHQRGSQVLAGVDLQALQAELLDCVQRHIRVTNGANINIAGACAQTRVLCHLVGILTYLCSQARRPAGHLRDAGACGCQDSARTWSVKEGSNECSPVVKTALCVAYLLLPSPGGANSVGSWCTNNKTTRKKVFPSIHFVHRNRSLRPDLTAN